MQNSSKLRTGKLIVDLKFGEYSARDDHVDGASVLVGSTAGLQVYNLQKDRASLATVNFGFTDIYIIDKFEQVIALVLMAEPNEVIFKDLRHDKFMAKIRLASPIRKVIINKLHVAVGTDAGIHIIVRSSSTIIKTVTDSKGDSELFDINLEGSGTILAWPSVQGEDGSLGLYDAVKKTNLHPIPAHRSAIVAIGMSVQGDKVATASEKGTVIRVFDLTKRKKICEFRRGLCRIVDVSSLSFSHAGQYVVCSSNTSTVHIFKMYEELDNSWSNMFLSYLPEMFQSETARAVATATLPSSCVSEKTICKVIGIEDQLMLIVANQRGSVYFYQFNKTDGEMNLVKQLNLAPDEIPDSTSSSSEDSATVASQLSNLSVNFPEFD